MSSTRRATAYQHGKLTQMIHAVKIVDNELVKRYLLIIFSSIDQPSRLMLSNCLACEHRRMKEMKQVDQPSESHRPNRPLDGSVEKYVH